MDIDSIKAVWFLIASPIMLLIGWNQVSVRTLRARLNNTYTKDEVESIVDLKLEPTRVDISHISTNLNRVEGQIDQLIKLHLK